MLFFPRSTTIDKNLSHFHFQAQATISDYLHQHEFTKQFVTDELVWYLVGTNWPSVKTLFSPFFCCTLLFWRGLMYYLSLQAAALLVMPVFVLYTLLVDTFWSVFSFLRVELVLFALLWWPYTNLTLSATWFWSFYLHVVPRSRRKPHGAVMPTMVIGDISAGMLTNK